LEGTDTNLHRRIGAIGLRVVGALAAIGPAWVLVVAAQALWALHRLRPPADRPPLDQRTYGFWAVLDRGADDFDHLIYALSGVSAWLLGFVVVLAAIGLMIAGATAEPPGRSRRARRTAAPLSRPRCR
jgi:hypothetical protein